MTEEDLESTRCPTCGALVKQGAEWCGQCFTRLPGPTTGREPQPGPPDAAAGGGPDVPAPPMPVPPDTPTAGGGTTSTPADGGGSGGGGHAEGEASSPSGRGTPAALLAELWDRPTVPEPVVRGAPGSAEAPAPTSAAGAPPSAAADAEPAKPRPTWPCAVCGAANDLERDTCEACGAPFARLFQEATVAPDIEPKRAATFSLIFPGLGHAVAGRKAEGVARAILFIWAAATAILLLTAHPAGGLGFLAPMLLLFVISAGVWYVLTAYDAYRLASGLRQIVTSKVMLFGVAGLMLVSVASVLIMVTKAGHLH